MEKKKKSRFNIIDLVIIVVVVAGVAFGGYKFLSSRGTVEAPKRYKYTMVMDNWEQSNDTFENDKIKVGDRAAEKTVNANFGKITKIESEPSRTFIATAEGDVVKTSRPMHSYLAITVEGEGVFSANGGLLINGTQFFINKQYEVIIADSLFWLRILEIEKVEIS